MFSNSCDKLQCQSFIHSPTLPAIDRKIIGLATTQPEQLLFIGLLYTRYYTRNSIRAYVEITQCAPGSYN